MNLEELAAQALARHGPPRLAGANLGHGHVFPRKDGLKARCGGEGFCSDCAQDKARFDREVKAATDFILDTSLGGP